MMSDIPPTMQDRLKPLFFQKDMYADKLCQTGKDIRRVQLELMKTVGPSKETLLRSQRLIDETKYLTAKLRALEREIDGILTQEVLLVEGEAGWTRNAADLSGGGLTAQPAILAEAARSIGPGSAEQVFEGNLRSSRKTCDQVFEENLRVECETVEG